MKVNKQQRSCELTPGLYFAFKISHLRLDLSVVSVGPRLRALLCLLARD
jgi:hypothetical protein